MKRLFVRSLFLKRLFEATTGMKRVLQVHKVVMAAVSEKIEALIDKYKDKDCVEVRNIEFNILTRLSRLFTVAVAALVKYRIVKRSEIQCNCNKIVK